MTTTATAVPTTTTAGGTSSFAGSKLLADGDKLSTALHNGDWISGGMAAFDLIDDALDAAADPIGTLMGAGLGWLMEHMEPIKGWLGQLAGNAAEVQQHAQTWSSISGKLGNAGSTLQHIISDLEGQKGDTVDDYRRFQQQAAEHIKSASSWTQGISSSIASASKIVTVVHDLVKQCFSELVSAAIQWVAEAAATLGLGMPFVIAQVINKVRTLVNKIAGPLRKLLESVKSLVSMFGQLTSMFQQFKSAVSGTVPGQSTQATQLSTVTASKPTEYGTGTTTDYVPPVGLSAADAQKLNLMQTQTDPSLQSAADQRAAAAAAATQQANAGLTTNDGLRTAASLSGSSAAGGVTSAASADASIGTGSGTGSGSASDLAGPGTNGATLIADGSTPGSLAAGGGAGFGGADGAGGTGTGVRPEGELPTDEWRRNARI
jgi:hypothetical protein